MQDFCRIRLRYGSTSVKIGQRNIDVVVGVLSIVIVIPVWISIAVAVKFDSEGPVFVSFERIGRDGRPFRLRKFRTVYVDGNERLLEHLNRNPYQRDLLQRSHILLQDPRVTRVGRFLRMSSLDESPQFWNVVRGEMSFIGPRALRPSEVRTGAHLNLSSEKPGIAPAWEVPWMELKITMRRCFNRVRTWWIE